jgi:hypothetical protein
MPVDAYSGPSQEVNAYGHLPLIDLRLSTFATIISVAPVAFEKVIAKTTVVPIDPDDPKKSHIGKVVKRVIYKLPASGDKPSDYTTCRVYETVENPFAYDKDGNLRLTDSQVHTPAFDEANQMVKEWAAAGPYNGGQGMGIAVLPEGDEVPTQELLNKLKKQQLLHMEETVKFANQEYQDGNVKFITQMHRDYANRIGFVCDWSGGGEQKKHCPGCYKLISYQSVNCDACGDLIAFYELDGHSPETIKASDPITSQRWTERLERKAKIEKGKTSPPTPAPSTPSTPSASKS